MIDRALISSQIELQDIMIYRRLLGMQQGSKIIMISGKLSQKLYKKYKRDPNYVFNRFDSRDVIYCKLTGFVFIHERAHVDNI